MKEADHAERKLLTSKKMERLGFFFFSPPADGACFHILCVITPKVPRPLRQKEPQCMLGGGEMHTRAL